MSVVAAAASSEPGPLRPRDEASLVRFGRPFEVVADGLTICVVISGWEMPPGLQPEVADVLVRLPQGFPDTAPDMFWLSPRVTAGGRPVPGTDATETYLGRSWQRWSRHFGGTWRRGVDDLASLLAIVRRCLADAAGVTP